MNFCLWPSRVREACCWARCSSAAFGGHFAAVSRPNDRPCAQALIEFHLLRFYLFARGDWERLLACLLGFVIARFLVMSLTGASAGHRNLQANEAGHASQS